MTDRILLRAEHVKRYFPISFGLFGKKFLKAVDDVSLELREGETLALVGESGCGKSTLGKTLIRAIPPTGGNVTFCGEVLDDVTLKRHITDMQMIFQDPMSSLNPRMSVRDIIAEPMIVCGTCRGEALERRVRELMDLVGLRRDMASRYPHEFSGGQCQRIGIARAVALNPKLIVCDEPVSALDVSVKAQIINMFADIQRETGVSYLFITHDMLTVRYVSHRIAVMYLGRIMELADTEELFGNPLHPYTQALLSAVLVPDANARRRRIAISGETPSPMDAPSGCLFRTRCRRALPECSRAVPELRDIGGGHEVACLRVAGGPLSSSRTGTDGLKAARQCAGEALP